ncbi:hypothetical protein IGI89_001099 [Enterococcus sp. AZ141]|uniref:hypothetical protein n=1 Tax=unclassified Enterococcus TaxID=2608891 RepID=UPI003D28BFA4
MQTYKQNEKKNSRDELWRNAIYSLTVYRNTSKILREDRVRDLWNYFIYDFGIKSKTLGYINGNYINEWMQFSESLYQKKTSADLKIVYLCGPEPENDLNIMLKYGIKLENIWAVESDSSSYNQALQSLKDNYIPNLKIFKGQLTNVLKLLKIQFDIIYLDFTKPLFSKETPLDTLHSIFDNNYLTDLGILITNFPTPNEIADKDVLTVSDFFYDFSYQEEDLRGETENPGSFYSTAGEFISQEQFKEQIRQNFDAAYSSFCTFYPMIYAANVSPIYCIINDDVARNQIFENAKLKDYINEKPFINEYAQYETGPYVESNDYYFIQRLAENLPESRIYNKYTTVANGKKYTHKQAITVGIQIKNNPMIDCVNEKAQKFIQIAYQNMKFWEESRTFCDCLFIHNLVELALNNLGQTYHVNLENHSRFSYTAKSTKMNVDIFTFDRCTPFYLSIPSLPMLENTTYTEESELFLRIMIDLIGAKQSSFTPLNNYKGSNAVGWGELPNIKTIDSIPKRLEKNS